MESEGLAAQWQIGLFAENRLRGLRGVSAGQTGTSTDTVRCQGCKQQFTPIRPRQHFCTSECSSATRGGPRNANWRGGASADQAAYALARYYRDPNRWKARAAARRAIAQGKIVPPTHCPKCGEQRKLQAHHHNGYEREHWLDVSFACDPCHRAEHRGRKSPKSAAVALAAIAAVLFALCEWAVWRAVA